MFKYKFSTRLTRPVNIKAGVEMIYFKKASVQWKIDDWSFKRRRTIGGIQISVGLRLVGFEFEARRGTIGEIQISEGLRLVEFTIPLSVPRP